MEIEFNPNRVGKTDPAQPLERQNAPTRVRQGTEFDHTARLQQILLQLPMVRPEKIDYAKDLVSDVKYPPEALMNGIARLLALHLHE